MYCSHYLHLLQLGLRSQGYKTTLLKSHSLMLRCSYRLTFHRTGSESVLSSEKASLKVPRWGRMISYTRANGVERFHRALGVGVNSVLSKE